MFTVAQYRRSTAAALFTLALFACEDSSDPPLNESKIATIRLTVGNQTIIIDETCVVTGGPIRIGAGNTPIAATFLLENGTADPVVTSTEFELRVGVANTGLATFARTGAFTGALTKVAAGSTTATISLFHFDEEHTDISCANVPLQVQ
jgi:hypothetical protein